MSQITVIGTGYVGLVTGSCLSDFGHKITCVDNDQKKIARLLKGEIPIYEPGLEAIVERNAYYGRLNFTTETAKAVKESEVIFIAVGTPPADDGSADLQYVEAVARAIARAMDGYRVIVDKSTVPIGTGQKVRAWIQEELDARGVSYDFDVVSNPEFLREGSAVGDFTHPDRIVIGTESERARDTMRQVYRVLYLNETPFIETNIETAEMIKYAANAFLAMKITFINEVANLSEKVGANVQDVARAMGRDGRISPKFLHAGPGYGGSCFPKDTKALAEIGKAAGARLHLIEQTVESNERQKHIMAEKVGQVFADLSGKTLAVLGLAFKPNTDDMRESPAITIISDLAAAGAHFRAYDPEAMEEAAWRLEHVKNHVAFTADEYQAMDGADAVLILTEWNQFRNLDLQRVKKMLKQPYFFDLRNIYNRPMLEELGFTYIGVGV
jgi:UDPglucose 6-dehydrogenase